MRKRYLKPPSSFLLVLAVLQLFFACSDNGFDPQSNADVPFVYLRDAWMIDPYRDLPQYKFTLSNKNIFRIPAELTNINSDAGIVKYHVSVQKLEYITTYKGQEITASGLILLPISPEAAPPIVSFHHGAIFAERNVPSNISDSLETLGSFHILPALVLAGSGFVTFVPDYIGHGTSSQIIHPDHIFEPSANAVIDMLLAGREFMREEGIVFDEKKLFLAGYSEGGYVTMAAQKAIEENPEWGLPLTASAPGGGNYNFLLGLPELDSDIILSPNTFSRRVVAWNEYYFQSPLSDFFQEPYVSRVSWIFDGELDFNETNELLTNRLFELLNYEFIRGFESGEESRWEDAIQTNSLTNWQPKVPTRIYKGTYDNFRLAQEEYDIFINEHQADPAIVELVPLEKQNHYGAAFPYLESVVQWFHTF